MSTRLLTAILVAGIFFFATIAHAAIKTYDGYGESLTSPVENPDVAKLRAKDSAIEYAKTKASLDLMSVALSKKFALAEDEIFAIINHNLKEIGEPDYDTEIVEHSEKTSVIIFKARIKISVDLDGLANWLKLEQESKDALLSLEQELSAEDKQKVAELRERATLAKTQEELAQIKAEFEQINNNYLALQKYFAANKIYSRGQYADALKLYDESIVLKPGDAYVYIGRGNAYQGLKQYERAIQDYDKAITLQPHTSAYNNRGIAYAGLGQYEQAIEDFDKAIELNPNYYYAYCNRGICYQKLGDEAKAQADFAKAKELGYKN